MRETSFNPEKDQLPDESVGIHRSLDIMGFGLVFQSVTSQYPVPAESRVRSFLKLEIYDFYAMRLDTDICTVLMGVKYCGFLFTEKSQFYS